MTSTTPLETVNAHAGVGVSDHRNDRSALRPWFRADWLDVLFLHYSIDPAVLQPHVPFDLDLHDGTAWVSLVPFTQSGLRPAAGGRLTSWITRPVARHVFMNLRTYVRGPHGERAIYFLAEWIPNPLSLMVGPALYGLPLRFADMTYTPTARTVAVGKRRIRVEADDRELDPAEPALSDFLVERYTAFTCRNGRARMFHIRHAPWPVAAANLRVLDDSLVRNVAPWFARAKFESAHASPGVRDVAIGNPIKVETARPVAPHPSALVTWTPLLLLPLLAFALKPLLPGWAFMWALAYGLFFGSKWATWRQAMDLARAAPAWKSLAYLLGWPGMDARAFLARPARQVTPDFPSWIWPLAKTIFGILLLFTVPRLIAGQHPILAGWAGMTGLILALHFGTFELLALFWRRMGVNAVPIMNAPWRSATLGEFWGARWNRGFRDLSHGWLFRPLLPLIGAFGATYVTFAVSGLVHDLVISAPAGAGYFLPTLYFLFQAAGLLIERTPWMKRHARGLAARAFTIAVVALPAPLLFHSAFVLNVILPFFKTIHAI